jgi:hypothetical protein
MSLKITLKPDMNPALIPVIEAAAIVQAIFIGQNSVRLADAKETLSQISQFAGGPAMEEIKRAGDALRQIMEGFNEAEKSLIQAATILTGEKDSADN